MCIRDRNIVFPTTNEFSLQKFTSLSPLSFLRRKPNSPTVPSSLHSHNKANKSVAVDHYEALWNGSKLRIRTQKYMKMCKKYVFELVCFHQETVICSLSSPFITVVPAKSKATSSYQLETGAVWGMPSIIILPHASQEVLWYGLTRRRSWMVEGRISMVIGLKLAWRERDVYKRQGRLPVSSI